MKYIAMDNIELFKLLEKSICLSKGSRFQRIRKSPQKMLYSQILKIAALWSGRHVRIKAKTFWNEDMYLVIPEVISLNIYRYGFFEEGLTRMVLKYLKPGMTFFDIGAHFGYYTLLASHIVGNCGQVHAFEPVPSTFEILKFNAATKQNIILNRLAIFSDSKVIELHDYGLEYCAYNSFREPRLDKSIRKRLKPQGMMAKATSLNEYVQETRVKPDFIKIDAESTEYEILIGMERTITKFYPIISIEVGDFGVKGVPMSKDIVQFLTDKGYHPYEFREGKILQHHLRNEQYQYENILFLPGK